VAIVASLLVAPLSLRTVLGVLAALAAPVVPPVARGCVWLAGWPAAWLVAVADRAAAVPGTALPWPAGAAGALLMVGALGLLALVGRARRRRAVLLAALAGATVVIVPTRLIPPGWPPAGWAVVACDVGQGDAIVDSPPRDRAG
jgi:competence protein ComEC